jgi:hypothetical protein
MGHHRPESPKGFRGNGDAKLGDVSFKKRSDKAFTPLSTVRLGIGKKSSGQTTPYP